MAFEDTPFAKDEAQKQSENQLTPENIKDLILDNTDLTEHEVDQQAQDKLDEFDGLVGKTGAYCLVARDHGIQPNQELNTDDTNPELTIENVVPQINDLQITVTVDTVQSTNTFEKDGETNRVRNVVVKDETGRTQLTLWGDDVEIADQLQPGDHLRIEGGYTSESDWCQDRYGCPTELRIGDSGQLIRERDGGEEVLVDRS